MNVSEPRILCVDNDRAMTAWIKNALRNFHVTTVVTCVETGREAFALLNAQDLDLCILEYALPDMTGAQLCALIRHAGCEVPMMIFTAMDRPVDRQRAFACGADEYLVKPDDLGLFHSTVPRLLDRRRRRSIPYSNVRDLSRAA